MRHPLTLLLAFCLSATCFISCHHKEEADIDELLEDETTEANIAPATDTTFGTIVKYQLVKDCLQLYKDTLKHFGLTGSLPVDTSINVIRTMQISTSEMFRGKELRKFLRHAAWLRKKFLSNNKHLKVKIAFGVYTQYYLDHMYDGMKNPPKVDQTRLHRIGIFLVTGDWSKWTKDSNWTDHFDGDDEDSLDFGGLEP